MKVLVTGREGQLARSLRDRAAEWPNIDLAALGRPELDLETPGNVGDAIRSIAPDVVVNAAAYTAVDDAEDQSALAFRINAEAAGEAASAAREIGAPIIQISTDYVFDGSARSPIFEDQTTSPLGVYGASKLAGEEQVRAADPDHAILRTSWLISPFGRNFARTMLGAARSRETLTVVADQIGTPTSAHDLADAILALVARSSDGVDVLGRTYHVAGSGEASWFELAQAIMVEARRHGLPSAEVRPIRSEDWPARARRPLYSVLDSSRFAVATGFVMPCWRKSISGIVGRLAG